MNRFAALCPSGMEPVLRKELKFMGVRPSPEESLGRVNFEATWKDATRTLLWSRVSDRILWIPGEFKARSFDEYFQGLSELPWEESLRSDTNIVIEQVRAHSSDLSPSPTLQKMAAKAIYQKVASANGLRRLPLEGPRVSIRIQIQGNHVYPGIDLSGIGMNKRGYRVTQGDAPIRETIAAGLILQLGWKRSIPFWDPMCGSGTFLAEAMMYGWNMAPGLGRTFSYPHTAVFSKKNWDLLIQEAKDQANTSHRLRIFGSDKDSVMINKSNRNLSTLSKTHPISLETKSFSGKESPPEDKGILLANPPYGKRMGLTQEALELHSRLMGWLESQENWSGGIITSANEIPGFRPGGGWSRKKIRGGNLELYFWRKAGSPGRN